MLCRGPYARPRREQNPYENPRDIPTLPSPSNDRYPWTINSITYTPSYTPQYTHSLLYMVELPQHEVHIDEDDGEAQDEVIDVSPDCPGGNVTKAVGNIDLGFKKKNHH